MIGATIANWHTVILDGCNVRPALVLTGRFSINRLREPTSSEVSKPSGSQTSRLLPALPGPGRIKSRLRAVISGQGPSRTGHQTGRGRLLPLLILSQQLRRMD